MVLKGDRKLQYVSTDDQVADVVTKLSWQAWCSSKRLSSPGGTMMLILKTFLARKNSDVDTEDFPRKEEK